jgi:hypothetical protein
MEIRTDGKSITIVPFRERIQILVAETVAVELSQVEADRGDYQFPYSRTITIRGKDHAGKSCTIELVLESADPYDLLVERVGE